MTACHAMAKNTLLRPTLLPGLARLWRNRHTLQLGTDPARAVLLELADPTLVRLLDLLDGSRSMRAILDHAARINLAREDAQALMDTLHTAGLIMGAHSLLPANLPATARLRLSAEAAALALRGRDAPATPAQILRRRAAARIVLTGRNRLAAPVAITLARAGVGHVCPDLAGQLEPADAIEVGLWPEDLPRPRPAGAAVAEAIAQAVPGTETRPVRIGRASMVVLLGADRPANLMSAGYAQRRQAHLMIDIRDGTPVVGPLVIPTGSPCLNCLDLHRRDRDPDWPELSSQIALIGAATPCDTTTLLAAASFAAAEILAYLDGGPPDTLGAAVEIRSPGRLRRRTWPPHPNCRCLRRRAAPGAAEPRPGRGHGARSSVTMSG